MDGIAPSRDAFLAELLAMRYVAIVWGHPLGSHTHAWIHYGFYRAFRHLGFRTLWLKDSPGCARRLRSLERGVIITEGQADRYLKGAVTDKFIVFGHNCTPEDYQGICQFVPFQVKMLECSAYLNPKWWPEIPRDQREKNKVACETQDSIHWATDLLPHEIVFSRRRPIYDVSFVGTVWNYNEDALAELERELRSRRLHLRVFSDVNQRRHLRIIRSSRFAPAIQGDWQVGHGYIPCRLFKNISYSALGISNNPAALKVFDLDEIVCTTSLPEMIETMLRLEQDGKVAEMVRKAQERIRKEHTYLNRIRELAGFYLATQGNTIS